MNNREWSAIAGQFSKVAETDHAVIVGCFGTMFADRLTPWQIDHIIGFYGLSGHNAKALPNYTVIINQGIYNGFLYISK